MPQLYETQILGRPANGPGIAVEAVFLAGVCAAGRIVVHESLSCERIEGGTVALASEAQAFYFAFYPDDILSNGREPHDQPMLSAYVPLAYSAMNVLPLAGYGALLVQREPKGRPRELTLMADGVVSLMKCVTTEHELKDALCEVAALAGVPAGSARAALQAPRALIGRAA